MKCMFDKSLIECTHVCVFFFFFFFFALAFPSRDRVRPEKVQSTANSLCVSTSFLNSVCFCLLFFLLFLGVDFCLFVCLFAKMAATLFALLFCFFFSVGRSLVSVTVQDGLLVGGNVPVSGGARFAVQHVVQVSIPASGPEVAIKHGLAVLSGHYDASDTQQDSSACPAGECPPSVSAHLHCTLVVFSFVFSFVFFLLCVVISVEKHEILACGFVTKSSAAIIPTRR